MKPGDLARDLARLSLLTREARARIDDVGRDLAALVSEGGPGDEGAKANHQPEAAPGATGGKQVADSTEATASATREVRE